MAGWLARDNGVIKRKRYGRALYNETKSLLLAGLTTPVSSHFHYENNALFVKQELYFFGRNAKYLVLAKKPCDTV